MTLPPASLKNRERCEKENKVHASHQLSWPVEVLLETVVHDEPMLHINFIDEYQPLTQANHIIQAS